MFEPDPGKLPGVRFRGRWLCLCVLSSSAQIAAGHPSLETTLHDFNIADLPLIEALAELERQAGDVRLDYSGGSTEEGRAKVAPLQGKLTLQDALSKLLGSSNLSFRFEPPNLLIIEPLPAPETPTPPVRQAPAPAVSAHSTQATNSTQATPEEIVVLGYPYRKITDPVFSGMILDKSDLAATGAPRLSEVLGYIPQNAFSRPQGYHLSGAQYAEMRGLGPDAALVLINGRRTFASATSLASNAFDLNTIPMAAVERVELIYDSPSIAYGTDASGGTINIVLRRKVAYPTIEFRYGGAEGGAIQRGGTLHFGTTSDRFDGALTFDYFDESSLLGYERERWRNLDRRAAGGLDLRSLVSSPGNVMSVNGLNLPGLNAPIAAVPLIDLTPGISQQDFAATAGAPNLDSLLKYSSIVPKSTRRSVAGNGALEINDWLLLSAELLYAKRSSTFSLCPPALAGLLVPATNAHSPFDVTVVTFRLASELGPQSQTVESELFRVASALQGQFGDWQLSISALYSSDRAETWMDNALDVSPGGTVEGSLANSNPALALNPFTPGAMGTDELWRDLFAPRDIEHFSSRGTQFILHGEGPLAQIGAGPITMMLGAEWRREAGEFEGRVLGSFDRQREIGSAYAQLQLPIVAKNSTLPGIHQLYASAATRLDDYDDVGRVVRSQYGFVWHPIRPIKVRVFQGHSFRPPSLYELYLPQITTPTTVSDPARGGELKRIGVITGGNDRLEPQTARTLTAGVAFSLDPDSRPIVSIDYWRVTQNDRVSVLTPGQLLDNESLFPDRITRAGGMNGELLAIDASRINTARLKASGIDFALRGEFPTQWGHFTPQLLATWIDSFRLMDVPGQPFRERVNLANEAGTTLKWRAIASLEWSRGAYGAGAAVRFSPAYDDALAGVRTGREISSQALFDLHGSADLGGVFGSSSMWDGINLKIGAFNLFDLEPDVAAVGGPMGFDLSQGDLKRRSLYLHLTKRL